MILALLILLATPQAAPPLADLLTRARDHIEAGDKAAARGDLAEALRRHPASPAVRNFLGVLAASEGDSEEAERRFREAVQRDPRYTDAWLNLGRLYQENAAKDAGAPRKALARFYVRSLLPEHGSLLAQMRDGAETVLALTPGDLAA